MSVCVCVRFVVLCIGGDARVRFRHVSSVSRLAKQRVSYDHHHNDDDDNCWCLSAVWYQSPILGPYTCLQHEAHVRFLQGFRDGSVTECPTSKPTNHHVLTSSVIDFIIITIYVVSGYAAKAKLRSEHIACGLSLILTLYCLICMLHWFPGALLIRIVVSSAAPRCQWRSHCGCRGCPDTPKNSVRHATVSVYLATFNAFTHQHLFSP